ncbi:hypothetical protein [Nocardia africana]|uniref:Uncharacterized protein n=1 Tax=Nocardia africana TaxID=134964 RepID=A0ABW6NAY2_9NOCA
MLASLFRGVGGLARLLHLFDVGAQLVQFGDRARFASFTRFPGHTLFAFDARHDLPEFAGNTPCSFAGCLFASLSYFILPQPFCRFADSRKALLRSTAPVLALLLSFEFALPDQFSDVLKSFARPIGATQLVGPNQLELFGSQRSPQLYRPCGFGPGEDSMFEPARKIASQRSHFLSDGTRDLLARHGLPFTAGQLAGFERCPLSGELIARLTVVQASGFTLHPARTTTFRTCAVQNSLTFFGFYTELPHPSVGYGFPAYVCSTEFEVQTSFIACQSSPNSVVFVGHRTPRSNCYVMCRILFISRAADVIT